jgi:quercetin dioxygenase-like cupin family protein
VLEEAGVWHRIAANADGSVEYEDAYTLEVKEVDLVRAGEVVERAMNLPEG